MNKKVKIIVERSRYDPCYKNGSEHISVSYGGSIYGGCYPCDTQEQKSRAIAWAKEAILENCDKPILEDMNEVRVLGCYF